jgi:ATPase subunit of ABC transporter with duplicated ATPase domains
MRATFPVFFCPSRSPAAVDVLKPPIVSIKNATFYKQQPTQNDTSNPPWFPNLSFSLPSSSRNPPHWSIISPSSVGKTTFLEVLQGQHLCFPPKARLYPYLSTEEVVAKDPQLRLPARALKYVGFSDKNMALGGAGTTGAYLSARYESRRESTDFSLLDYLKGNTNLNPWEDEIAREESAENLRTLQQVVQNLKLESLLDMPVSHLSNGQTRRARIAKALMGKPEVILLDEPFSMLRKPSNFIQVLSV